MKMFGGLKMEGRENVTRLRKYFELIFMSVREGEQKAGILFALHFIRPTNVGPYYSPRPLMQFHIELNFFRPCNVYSGLQIFWALKYSPRLCYLFLFCVLHFIQPL